MRRIVSILMAFMMVLSVINLSVVSHLCQGEIKEVKVSVAGQSSLSCGMEDHSATSPSGKIFKKQCCENESSSLKVDSDYSPSYSKSLTVFQKEVHFAGILLNEAFKAVAFAGNTFRTSGPPCVVPIHRNGQAELCVFRI